MPTDHELAQQADKAFRATTIDYKSWQRNVRAGKYPALGPPSQWGVGFQLLNQIGAAPDPYLTEDWAHGIQNPWIKQGTCITEPGKLTVTAGPNNPGPFTQFYQAATYINNDVAHAAPGDSTNYRVPIMFPTGYKATIGEFNWVVAWHVAAPQAGPWSCALGVYTGGPVGGPTDPPGVDPHLFFVVRGGSIPNVQETRHTMSTPLKLGVWQEHQFKFRWQTPGSTTLPKFDWIIDGAPEFSTFAPNMLDDGLPNGFGLYNYKRLCTWDSSVCFGPTTIEPA